MYCGATVVVQEAIQAAAAATVPNLLKLARAAAEASNYQEAYDYFTRVLELDGGNSSAWAGKAEAVGKLSGQHSFRMPEMITYFRNAIEVATDEERESVQHRVANLICKIITDDYLKMREGLSPKFWEGATWSFYLNRVGELIKLLGEAHIFIPNNITILQTLVWFCDNNIGGVTYRSTFSRNTVTRSFHESWDVWIRELRSKYLDRLYSLKPELRPVLATNSAIAARSNLTKPMFVIVGFVVTLLVVMLFIVALTDSNGINTNGKETSVAPRTVESSTNQNYSTSLVCALPRKILPNSQFANLGGGSWRKWTDSGGELDHACEGGVDSVKLKNAPGVTDITSEYSVLGNASTVHYVSVEYTAFWYAGYTSDVKTLKQEFIEFCEQLSVTLNQARLPREFKRRLLDESSYYPTGTANEYGEPNGGGYVNLSANKNGKMIHLNVRFFPSAGDYRAYKNS